LSQTSGQRPPLTTQDPESPIFPYSRNNYRKTSGNSHKNEHNHARHRRY
jgi:hypothetical protein